MNIRNTVLSSLLALLPLSMAASDGGSTAFDYARASHSHASSAMAGTYMTNLSSSVWTSSLNPSVGVFSESGRSVNASLQNWAPDSGLGGTSYSIASGYNSGRIALSLAGTYMAEKPYDVYDEGGVVRGTFTPNDMFIGAGMGYRISETLSAGASLSFMRSTLAEGAAYSGIGAGASVTFHRDGLTAALAARDFGPEVKGAAGDGYSLPSSLALGAGYVLGLSDSHAVTAALDADYFLAGGFSAAVGVEYAYRDMVFARTGYRLTTGTAPTGSHLSLGAGFKYRGVEIGASFLLGNEFLSGTTTFGIGYSF